MKELTIDPTALSGGDCFHITATNILNFYNYEYATSIWKQCGLVYSKNGPKGTGVIRPYLLNRTQEMRWIHNVNLVKEKRLSKNDFVNKISMLINKGTPVMVNVDSYYLKYNPFFQKRHLNHYVIAFHINANDIRVVDDSYNFKGTLTIDELYNATVSKTELFDIHGEIMHFQLKNSKRLLTSEDYLNVIKYNYLLMSGDINEQKINEILVSLEKFQLPIVNWSKTIFGIPALYELIKDYRSFTLEVKNIDEEFFFNMYAMLTFMSNSRYLFRIFLEGAPNNININEEILFKLKKSTQLWKVSSNMMIKGMYKDGNDMIERMLNKLDEIITWEKLIVKDLDSYINNN